MNLKDYLYIERGRSCKHSKPRGIQNIIYSESMDLMAVVLSTIIYPFFKRKYKKQIEALCLAANPSFHTKGQDNDIAKEIANFIFRKFFYKKLLMAMRPKCLMAPVLILHYPLIIACKETNTPCYELQHGITTGPSTTYSGKFRDICSPDLFLSFGEIKNTSIFGMPNDKIINIGYAFKSWIKKINVDKYANIYLLISDPEITDKLIDIAILLKKHFPRIDFHFRPHPQEILSEKNLNDLEENNIFFCNKEINSTLCCLSYSGVLGVCSSVLYEAKSVGIKSACISFENLNPLDFPNPPSKEELTYLYSLDDFEEFINKESLATTSNYYSDFQEDAFKKLIYQ